MSQSDRRQLFDHWAKDYDTTVRSTDSEFPLGGYDEVLAEVVRLAEARPQMRILDLGIGTGNLAEFFMRRGCAVWGIDFSAEMLVKARAKLPQAKLIQVNLLNHWPADLQQPFDRVVSAYVLHEFDLETKISLLQRIAAQHLSTSGWIVIADIAFPTIASRLEASRHWADAWDEDETYWAAEEAIAASEAAGFTATYRQVSKYGGVFTFRRGLTK
jgi:putative AdoMet-dependent methyltransferase